MEVLGTTKLRGHMELEPKDKILVDLTSGEAKYIAEQLERVVRTGQWPYSMNDGENVLILYLMDE